MTMMGIDVSDMSFKRGHDAGKKIGRIEGLHEALEIIHSLTWKAPENIEINDAHTLILELINKQESMSIKAAMGIAPQDLTRSDNSGAATRQDLINKQESI